MEKNSVALKKIIILFFNFKKNEFVYSGATLSSAINKKVIENKTHIRKFTKDLYSFTKLYFD